MIKVPEYFYQENAIKILPNIKAALTVRRY